MRPSSLPLSAPLAATICVAFSAAVCITPARALGQSTPAPTDNPAPTGALSPVDVTPNASRGDGMYIPLLKDQPFKVRFNVEITKPLPDGSQVKQKYYVIAARDSAGYEYRESRNPVSSASDLEPALVGTIVYDPKNSTSTACSPSAHSCQQRRFNPNLQPADQPPLGVTQNGDTTIRREDLGKKQMDGLEVDGVRETQTVKSGNDKPLITTRETWYSPRLGFFLSVKITDPFGATRTVEAADLKLGEPGEDWFAIPEGYRVLVQRTTIAQARLVPSLEQSIAQHLSSVNEAELTQQLQPVDAAVLNYAKAHAAASPNDPLNKPLGNLNDPAANDISNSRLVNNLRMRLASEVQMMQMNNLQMNRQLANTATERMNTIYAAVIGSPCIAKPALGDPPTMPANAAGLEAEQKAWMQVYNTWTVFLQTLFPNSSPQDFGFLLANERASELERMQNVERNRGCIPVESMQASLERIVTSQTPEQLSVSLKPVDAALNAYIKAHVANQPNDNEGNFARNVEARLSADLQMQQQGRAATRDQFEESELHLNQAFRAVSESPCIDRHIPGDPPNAPASGDALRAEETAWVAMRDAWVKFVASLYPNNTSAGFGFMLTEQRAAELRQIQNIERNRGCRSDDEN